VGQSEIYIRKAYTKSYSENTIEITDSLEIFLQEIEMILSTPMTSVLGSPKFGASLDMYLHSIATNESDMVARINQQISQYSKYSSEYSFEVKVQFYKVGQSETAVVDVLVDEGNLVRIVLN